MKRRRQKKRGAGVETPTPFCWQELAESATAASAPAAVAAAAAAQKKDDDNPRASAIVSLIAGASATAVCC